MGPDLPRGRDNFWELFGLLIIIVSYCCIVCINCINNGVSTTAAADCIVPDWPVSHSLFLVKSPLPLRCGLLSTFFDHLLLLCLRHPLASAKAIYLWTVHPPRSSIWTDIVTMMSRQWLEQCEWNLGGLTTSPYWWTDYILKVKCQGHSRP